MSEQAFQHLQCHIEQEALIVTIVNSRLDGEKVIDELRRELIAVVDADSRIHVVLNLQNVQMLHTLVLKTLIDFRKMLLLKNGRVVLCSLQPVVSEVLRITAFIDLKDASRSLFEVELDVPAALARLKTAS